ncbi:flavin reductase family protein [Microvirga brassicacearum]|uniref:Flavin reductase family protein n=1 Tax=Microvirga brassicacearum TaxID=2580413 RepID=A0A5N3P7F4_9HYPH|nr:flavin reductase family protein [Microvirga brassicacearum]KAB0265669.1 flavin reductase family protein [Microvirga brassicacearum]
MFYETATNAHGLPHDPFKAIVTPRPIGWITAMSAEGEINLSPYSFFNAISEKPPMVAFSSSGRKDALTFIEETKEFVCNLATYDLRDKMNLTSAVLPRGESEMVHAGLAAAPSRLVKPPRVAEALAALECKWLQTIPLVPLEGGDASYYLVIGQVVGIHIDDRFIVDGLVDTAAMKPIARAGYRDYFVSTAETKFSIRRPGA